MLFSTLRNRRILLLIAHPDDEAMFFAPMLAQLTRPHLGNHLQILCLSNGNAAGLGAVRERELVQSALLLGIKDELDVRVLDDEGFQDSMSVTWSAQDISKLLHESYIAVDPSATRDGRAGISAIDTIITFDQRGISGHPNHISLYHGALDYTNSFASIQVPIPPISLYTLTSVNFLRKYASVLDAPWTILSNWLTKQDGPILPSRLVAVSTLGAYRRAQKAMTQAHVSQMVWFRWGWISIARYMVVNDLVRHDLAVL